MRGSVSGSGDENEKYFGDVCVSLFVCLRESFQMAKEDKLRCFFNSMKV